ncbi:MAG: NAD(P)/FAD-dependent oxidoreductase [Geminicoccaceae bacterium]
MSRRFGLAVIGAGPAGAHAAMAAAEGGVDCIVLDEAEAAGGQVYRAPAARPSKPKPEIVEGDRLRAELRGSGARLAFGRRVWLIEPGFVIHTVGDGGPERIEAEKLILATGTTERVIPFPGWTTPGVIGLAAATILLKSQATLPGRRTLVAGRGPLLAAVAAGILDLGGEVVAVLDRSPRSRWLRALPRLASRPDLLGRGIGWWAKLVRARVPVLHNSDIGEVTAVDDGLVVKTKEGEPFACDAVAVGHGLTPSTDITRLLGVGHRFAPELGGWVPEQDAFGRTNVDGLLVCGDGAGVRGAAVASLAGELAGLAAAKDLGHIDRAEFKARTSTLQAALAKAGRFGGAMAAMTAPRADDVFGLSPDTIICRCEDVNCGQIERAIEDGADTIDQLKAWTRAGMGPCQGRMCGEAVASLLARHVGGREKVGLWTGRSPIRPVPVADLVDDIAYENIPIPKAAPL